MIGKAKLSTEEIKLRVNRILNDYLSHPEVLKMKNHLHHANISTFDHALSVAYKAYEMGYRVKEIDLNLLTVCAFLHDFYLYDWHDSEPDHSMHGFRHASFSANNASRIFCIPKKGADAIRSHMWPLNITEIPRSREAWILTVADKKVSAIEILRALLGRLGKMCKRK